MTGDPRSSNRRRASQSADQPTGAGPAARPTHPSRAAAILMVAIVVLLVLVSVIPLL
ncbi:MAG: hypothetical protein M5U19_22150 [Microthrixaceae bacterium]|nr:hypothetical protein [Microthrixaceae bacterium]